MDKKTGMFACFPGERPGFLLPASESDAISGAAVRNALELFNDCTSTMDPAAVNKLTDPRGTD
jgi:hypothetical protein